MSINFPKSPSTDDTYTYLTTTWRWNGVAWEKSAATETGNTEGTTGGIAYYEGKSSTIKGALNAFYDETNERVGIGTSGPTELLDVRGGITANGGIFITGGATFGGDTQFHGNLILPEDGTISVEGDTEAITLNFGGGVLDISSSAVDFKQKIRHRGDPDTYIDFTVDNTEMFAGGKSFLNSDGVKTDIGGCTAGHSGFTADTLKVESELILGGNIILPDEGHIGGGDGQDRIVFDINGNHIDVNTNIVRINSKLEHLGDDNTHLDFDTTDSIKLTAGGNEFIHGTATGTNIGGCTAGHGGFTAAKLAVSGELEGDLIVQEDRFIGAASDCAIHYNDVSSRRLDMRANQVSFDNLLAHYGDGDTYIKFDTNQISMNAGGTTFLNANAAGVTMDQAPLNLKTYTETKNAIDGKSSDFDVNVSEGSVQTVTCSSGTIEVGFTGWNPSTALAQTVTLIITNGGNINTWDSAVKWPSDVAPSLTASGVDIITFMTPDAGTTVYGFVGGLNFS